jgi:ComF family protein
MERYSASRRPVGSVARLQSAMESILQALLPAPCLFCGAGPARHGICAGCLRDLPGLGQPRCPVCAIDLEIAELCGSCLRRRPSFDRVRAACSYAFPMDAAIQRLKYAPDPTLIAPLAALLADLAAAEPRPDLLVPMPASPARLRSRGFDQAVELARTSASRHGLRLGLDVVARVNDGLPQASLPWDERARNVRGAFACATDLSGLRVTIVDDVMTTGATLEELARTLKRAGALEVTAWVLARTPRG